MNKFFFLCCFLCASLSQANDLQDRLNKAALDCRSSEAAVAKLEAEIQAAETTLKENAGTLKTQQRKLGHLLIVLRNLEGEAPSHIVRHGKDRHSVLHGMTAMGAYIRSLHRQIATIKKALAKAEAQKKDLQEKRGKLFSEVSTYKEKRKKIEDLLQKKKAEETQKKAQEEKTKTLAKKASNLKELIKKLEKSAQFPQKGSEASGLLLPVQGPLIAPFGKTHAHSPDGKGVVFRTRAGSYVLAPTTGEVLFAGPFRLYKNIVILGFQKEHTVLITGLDKVSVQTGKNVNVGDPIGQMKEGQKGYLYLEMRKRGQAIKPEILGAE